MLLQLVWNFACEKVTEAAFYLNSNFSGMCAPTKTKQEAQLMLTTGSTCLAVSRGQQTWYHSTCNI